MGLTALAPPEGVAALGLTALGLAGVAVKAGVKSVLATLWYVDDEATSLAIREFYRQLKRPGLSKAEALQNAQKKLIAQQKLSQKSA